MSSEIIFSTFFFFTQSDAAVSSHDHQISAVDLQRSVSLQNDHKGSQIVQLNSKYTSGCNSRNNMQKAYFFHTFVKSPDVLVVIVLAAPIDFKRFVKKC